MTTFLLLFFLAADLSPIKAIPDLERRSEAALAFADQQVDAARTAYKASDDKGLKDCLEGIQESVELAKDALEEAPKKARNSKYYKRAELKTRALLRRLKALSEEVDLDSRKAVELVHSKVEEVHTHLLEDIMGNKK